MKKISYKWLILGFLFVTFFLEQATRQVYSATLPQIKLDFLKYGVNDTQLGLVGTVFGAVFGLSLVGSGLAADFLGRKRVLVWGTLLFSIGIFLSGFAQGLTLLVAAYGVMNAIGQCCVAPPSYSLISQYHDTTTRATAMSVFQAAVYLGIILGTVSSGALCDFGEGVWRWAFWILGAAGIGWALVMQAGLRDVAQPAPADEKPSIREAFMALLGKPTAILIAAAFGMFMYANFGIRLWTMMFVIENFKGIGMAEAAFHAVFWLNVGSLIGLVATARLMERFGRDRTSIRLEMSALGLLLGAAPIFWVSQAPTLLSCCFALTTLGLAHGVYEAGHYPAMFDCIAPRYRSAVTGLTGCCAFLFGSAAPVVLGWMGDHLSLRHGMMSLSAFYLVGALILVPAMLVFFKRDVIIQREV